MVERKSGPSRRPRLVSDDPVVDIARSIEGQLSDLIAALNRASSAPPHDDTDTLLGIQKSLGEIDGWIKQSDVNIKRFWSQDVPKIEKRIGRLESWRGDMDNWRNRLLGTWVATIAATSVVSSLLIWVLEQVGFFQ